MSDNILTSYIQDVFDSGVSSVEGLCGVVSVLRCEHIYLPRLKWIRCNKPGGTS